MWRPRTEAVPGRVPDERTVDGPALRRVPVLRIASALLAVPAVLVDHGHVPGDGEVPADAILHESGISGVLLTRLRYSPPGVAIGSRGLRLRVGIATIT